MNNYRSVLMFLIALIAGLGAMFIGAKWLQQRSTQVNQIVVSTQEINMGQKLTSSMFKLVDWPAPNVPPQAFTDLSKLEGRVTKSSLQEGEPVLASKLAPEGSLGGLSAVIAEGKRAITVRVNDVVGVAGFALPGNFVDIIVNTEKAEESNARGNSGKIERSISKIVLEHILVLAVAQEAGRDETKPKVVNAVTLEVSPEQAEMIDLARSIGDLSLVLRNQADVENTQTAGVTQNQLLEIKDPEPVQMAATPEQKVIIKKVIVKQKTAPAEPKNCTKVITGLTETKECF